VDAIDLVSQGKLKRYFRAKRKLNAPGLISHITQRSAGREPLFIEDEDYLNRGLRLTFSPQVKPHYDLADLSRLNPQRI